MEVNGFGRSVGGSMPRATRRIGTFSFLSAYRKEEERSGF
jgi:hypothetical protein